jgi:hypothetical protein
MKFELRFAFRVWLVWGLFGSPAGMGGVVESAVGPQKPPLEAERWLSQQESKISARNAQLLRRPGQ